MPKYHFEVSEDVVTNLNSSALIEGDYDLEIKASAIKTSKNGGEYIQLNYEILAPKEFSHGVIVDRFMTACENEQAVSISKKQLSLLCMCFNMKGFEATEELHGKQFTGHYSLDKARITLYKTYEGFNDVPVLSLNPEQTAALSKIMPGSVKSKKVVPLTSEKQKSMIHSDDPNDDLTF